MIKRKLLLYAFLCAATLLSIVIYIISCNTSLFNKNVPNPVGSEVTKPCPPTIQYRSQGSEVKTLQLRLNMLGWKDQEGKVLVVDGTFGKKTAYAVKNFQTKNDLSVDGIVGPMTWAALGYC